MIGSKISVAVADAKGNKDVSDETAPVAVYEELEILSADQKGAKTVALTFSDDVTASDKLTVKKGSTEVKIDSTTYGDESAEITLADKIIAGGKYTVTLTPANGDPATSVEFEGETATLDRIEFLNKKLVLANNDYDEGYCYVKGYDQFDGEVSLAGLSVTAGVGEMTAYDSSTGKITLKAKNKNDYMMIKEVPVFVQVQTGNQMKTASETLEVSTRAFVTELEFGEIKKDGTKRDDERLTITELSGGKYYVELLNVKDQYGNTLSADDLNDQRYDDKVLFVIPGDQGAFYTTGKFSTVNNTTVLWLAAPAGGAKPGSMPLTITGAGGATFTKDIEVEDDPYIDNITITYPELYSGASKSKKMDFVAVDQYNNAIDLWEFKPHVEIDNSGKATILEFGDENHMTNEPTKIVLSNAEFNTVTENSATKIFEVTVDSSNSDAKSMVVFTTTTAGTKVFTHSVTVGETGVAVKVKSPATASTQLDRAGMGANTSLNFNSAVQFEDVNGNTMVRGQDALYPFFTSDNLTINKPDANIKPADYQTFAWTVTSEKLDDATADGTNISALAKVDPVDKGIITADDFTGKADYYVTVFGSKTPNANNTSIWYKLDDQAFHVTEVVGLDKDTKYAVKAPATIYVSKDSKDAKKVTVTATTDNGETYTVADGRITLTLDSRWTVENNKVYGKVADGAVTGTGSVEATVWVDGSVEAGTIAIPYSDAKPVATKAELGWKASSAGSFVKSREGDKISGSVSDIELGDEGTNAPKAEIKAGVLTIENGTSLDDTITAQIKDQYGVVMTDTKFFLNGSEITDTSAILQDGRGAIEYRSGNVTNKFYFTATHANGLKFVTDADDVMTTLEVTSQDELTTAATTAKAKATADSPYTIKATKSFNISKATEIPTNTKFEVPEGVILGVGEVLTVNGSLKNEGTMTLTKANAITASGTSLETAGSGSIISDGTGTAKVTAGSVTLGGSGGATLDTVVTTKEVKITAGTNTIASIDATTTGGKLTISGGTNTITTLTQAAGGITVTGGDTTITTQTAASGTNAISAGKLTVTAHTGGNWDLSGGTLTWSDDDTLALPITATGGTLVLDSDLTGNGTADDFTLTATGTVIVLPTAVAVTGAKVTTTSGNWYYLASDVDLEHPLVPTGTLTNTETATATGATSTTWAVVNS